LCEEKRKENFKITMMRCTFLVFVALVHCGHSFVAYRPNSLIESARIRSFHSYPQHFVSRSGLSRSLELANKNEQQDDDNVGGLDASGFSDYLAPYILTFVLSILVTAAFFKFVLLDG
jgi:hypothetical protein